MISKEDIEGLAQLARLKLKDGEAESLGADINSILGYVGQVSAFNADSSALQTPLLHNVLRQDEPRVSDDPLLNKEEVVRAQFPKREGNYNAVKKILQKDE